MAESRAPEAFVCVCVWVWVCRNSLIYSFLNFATVLFLEIRILSRWPRTLANGLAFEGVMESAVMLMMLWGIVINNSCRAEFEVARGVKGVVITQ